MTVSRLTGALDSGALVLPEAGRIAVFRPRAGYDLSALPKDRVQVIQGFRPDHDAFAAAGYDTSVAAQGDYAAALVCVPRAKAEARALVARAMAATGGGPVAVDGQKADGIESLLKEARKTGTVGEALSKAHGKIFVVTGGDFTGWAEAGETTVDGGFVTVPGLFSADAVDEGSAALAAALPAKLPKRMADLGAGWGYLAAEVLTRDGVEELHLVEAEHAALDCARRNVTDPRARFHWADALSWRPDEPLDAIVTNPPFHIGRDADPGLGRGFIAAAAAMLKPSGRLWLVANRHLPYEAEARARFREVQEIAGSGRFKILAAAKPVSARGGGR
ncbi:methyltransferase [Psychromarinibacter sp. C21-152]|uniref:Methyltransferase n=1 Tax=Psychromarinibacter sediminicola TaxID=3033385 RepID=A0AAE3NNV6_9RHOB|nr:methyltransferase [Psychromarinibacter sediminicola]MDF0600778.1 methyltransferase [Psychromarinibacter sediminicola]